MTPEDQIRAKLQGIAKQIKEELPDGFVFVLLVASIGEGGTLLYVANCRRADALQVMREFTAVNSEERNWQREMPELELDEEFETWWQNQLGRFDSEDHLEFARSMCRDAFLAGRATA
jgi:hypothetical protein